MKDLLTYLLLVDTVILSSLCVALWWGASSLNRLTNLIPGWGRFIRTEILRYLEDRATNSVNDAENLRDALTDLTYHAYIQESEEGLMLIKALCKNLLPQKKTRKKATNATG